MSIKLLLIASVLLFHLETGLDRNKANSLLPNIHAHTNVPVTHSIAIVSGGSVAFLPSCPAVHMYTPPSASWVSGMVNMA